MRAIAARLDRRLLAIGVACLATAACSPTIRKPRLFHPGPADFQQRNAEQFDPYPPNDLGPKIDGGRPIDYEVPPNEVTRANQYRATLAPPVVPLAPAPVVGTPVASGPFVPGPVVPVTPLPTGPMIPSSPTRY